jgi:hypothetical protein
MKRQSVVCDTSYSSLDSIPNSIEHIQSSRISVRENKKSSRGALIKAEGSIPIGMVPPFAQDSIARSEQCHKKMRITQFSVGNIQRDFPDLENGVHGNPSCLDRPVSSDLDPESFCPNDLRPSAPPHDKRLPAICSNIASYESKRELDHYSQTLLYSAAPNPDKTIAEIGKTKPWLNTSNPRSALHTQGLTPPHISGGTNLLSFPSISSDSVPAQPRSQPPTGRYPSISDPAPLYPRASPASPTAAAADSDSDVSWTPPPAARATLAHLLAWLIRSRTHALVPPAPSCRPEPAPRHPPLDSPAAAAATHWGGGGFRNPAERPGASPAPFLQPPWSAAQAAAASAAPPIPAAPLEEFCVGFGVPGRPRGRG